MLDKNRRAQRFSGGAAIGSGAIAMAAAAGGVDFILALNAGRFRIMGEASPLSMLPVRESNGFTLSFAVDELLNRCPVAGVFRGQRDDALLAGGKNPGSDPGLRVPGHHQLSHLRPLSGAHAPGPGRPRVMGSPWRSSC